MSKKLDSISEGLKALKQGSKTTAPALEHLNEPKTKKKPNRGNRANWGGRREGSGLKPLEHDEKKKTLKRSWEDFAQEITEITEIDKGTREVRKVKMQRLRVVQEKLFKGVLAGDVSAIKEFNNRVHGHPKQPIVGDDDEAPVQVELGVERILDKTYGADEGAE